MATKYGIGHQCTIDLLADGSGRKCMTLRNGAYVRELSSSKVALGTWNEFWLGLRSMLKIDMLMAGVKAYGGSGYNRYAFMGISLGVCAGVAGASAYTDVDANTTHFLGIRAPLTSFGTASIIPAAIGTKQINPICVAYIVKNGVVSKGTSGTVGFNPQNAGFAMLRLVRSGGNLSVSSSLWGDRTGVSEAQALNIMNQSTYADAKTVAIGYGNFTEAIWGVSDTDEESTYGTLSHIEVGWWQNTTGLQLDMILARTL